jgi:cell shape-determining protein MreC
MSEAIEIETGDLILFGGSGGILRSRLVFGEVTQGIARNESGLRQIKVTDEFSGKTLSPKGWHSIFGVWKSNSLSQRRTKSVRNWSFQ